MQNEYNCVINNQPEICEGGRFFLTNFIQTNFYSGITDLQQIGIHSMQDMITIQTEGVTKHQNKAWADTLFIQATAVYLGIPIHVMSMTSNQDHPFVKILPSFCHRNSTSTCAILLGNENSQHFQSFLPKQIANPTIQTVNEVLNQTESILVPENELQTKAKQYCNHCCKSFMSLTNHQHSIKPNNHELTTTCRGCPTKTFKEVHKHFSSKKGLTCVALYLATELKIIAASYNKTKNNQRQRTINAEVQKLRTSVKEAQRKLTLTPEGKTLRTNKLEAQRKLTLTPEGKKLRTNKLSP